MLFALLAASAAVSMPTVPLHAFEDPAAWKPHRDGGLAVEVSRGQPAGMHLRYVDGPPHWGNLVGACTVPPDAVALRVRFRKHASASHAAMYVWLLERDGDAWNQEIRVGGRQVGEAPAGPYQARLPVGAFNFEPRGPGTRQMPSVDRMLIGCNYGDLEVTMDAMEWETAQGVVSAPLPRTQGLKPARGPKGSVAVLDMGPGLPDGFRTAHPPRAFASALRSLGYGGTVLRPGDLADPAVLTRERFDAVVLPFGPYFPVQARDTFVAYLRAGGSFLSTDGYAYDRLVVWTGNTWVDEGAATTAAATGADPSRSAPMNTRRGQPGDAMTFRPDQIGVFDPQFRLEGASVVRASGRWAANGANAVARAAAGRPIAGYAACALIGDNSPVFPPVYRRWEPVLQATSRSGEPCGPALAIAHNFAGAYAGSSWAFSGLTSGTDLLLGTPERRRVLGAVLQAITRQAYLHSPTTDLALYEPGETARVSVQAANRGRQPVRGEVVITVGGKQAVRQPVTLRPGQTTAVTAKVAITAAMPDLCPVRATLVAPGSATDEVAAAFCVRNAAVIAKGPRVRWRDNYLTVDGKPRFLVGTNQTGLMFYSAHEGPAVWDRDFRLMGQHGVHVLRILHFSPYAARGYQGDASHSPLELASRPLKLQRQTDAIVQLAQKHRVALFLSLHDWQNVTLTDEELAAQADWNRFWAARYRDVPGILYDVQNEPSVDVPDRPDVVALWNAWLRGKYGTDDALRQAWALNPPEAALPNVPLGKLTEDWRDVRSADRKRFEAELLNRWVKANVDGVRAGNPNAPVTVGYLPGFPPADKMLGQRYTDFSNMHYYGSLAGFPLDLKLTDRRFEGKGFSLGEFGAQEAHDSRTQGSDDLHEEACIRRFRQVTHLAAGMGAAFVCNWSWKEADEMVFPWGLLHRQADLGKPWLDDYAQDSLFLSFLQPAYRSPEVFLLAPDASRVGPRFDEMHRGLFRAAELLLNQRADFGVINEESLDRLPDSVKALYWPLAYCPSDPTFARVLDWVRAGGTLYLSGGVAFDASRRPTRADRMQALGLPDLPVTGPFEAQPAVAGQPPLESAVGRGKVLFVPYPVELQAGEGDAALYAQVLSMAGIVAHDVLPATAPVRTFETPLVGGGTLTTLVRTDGEVGRLLVKLPARGVSMELGPGGCAFVVTDAAGEVVAAETDGRLEAGDRDLASADGAFALVALDGAPLARSRQVLVLPHHASEVELAGLDGLRGASYWVGGPDLAGTARRPFGGTITVGRSQVAIIAPAAELAAARRKVRTARDLSAGK